MKERVNLLILRDFTGATKTIEKFLSRSLFGLVSASITFLWWFLIFNMQFKKGFKVMSLWMKI